ncbi:hypothetical protein [uncultured Desulfuromonas sp.]|uniref:hypothetical protein n=1 Tax=uncultured Desulfuromonas sp. TaxID=181013 RepID=UPI002AAB7FE1|nr:hypothetical protein [uncultured Desulfuromonas sp.]
MRFGIAPVPGMTLWTLVAVSARGAPVEDSVTISHQAVTPDDATADAMTVNRGIPGRS